jgi:uncharacterized protein (DUF983 family)
MANPPRRAPMPPAHQVLGRALRLAALRRCPACGEGDIWDGWLTIRRTCPACGMDPARGEHDMFIGALLVNFVVAELIVVLSFVTAMILTYPDTPWRLLTWGTAAVAVLAPIVTYPFTLTFWLAIDFVFRPPGFER